MKIIGSELQRIIKGDVWLDTSVREAYSTAVCMYKVLPYAVVAPKDIEDVQRLVTFCSENEIAIIPRGGATGMVGQAVGLGIIVDFKKYFHSFIQYNVQEQTVKVQAGVITSSINKTLLPHKRIFPVDPQSWKDCTIGGNIATNASGPHGIKYGATKDHVKEMTVVLSNGELAVLQNDAVTASSTASKKMFDSTAALLHSHKELIASKKPKTAKWSSGYNIFEATTEIGFNPIKLFCGSEGTLGIVTDAVLDTIPIPPCHLSVVVYCDSYEQTAEATQVALNFDPSAVELLDKSYADYGKGMNSAVNALIDKEFQAMLAIEFEGVDSKELLNRADTMVSKLRETRLISDSQNLITTEDQNVIWALREEISQQLNRLETVQKKISVVEDGTVPIKHLPSYLTGVKRILNNYRIPFTLYGHAGTGNVHCATLVDFSDDASRRNIELAAIEIFDLALSLDGVLSGEHGDGYVRTPFQRKAFGNDIYAIFEKVKTIFDPQNIFNPGKVVGKQDGNFLHDIKYS